jgi:hypothetical protein
MRLPSIFYLREERMDIVAIFSTSNIGWKFSTA